MKNQYLDISWTESESRQGLLEVGIYQLAKIRQKTLDFRGLSGLASCFYL